jgi:hypothetical protein
MRKKIAMFLSSVLLLTSCSSFKKNDSNPHTVNQYAGTLVDVTVLVSVLLPIWLTGAAYDGIEDLVTTDRSEFTSNLKCLEPYNLDQFSEDYLKNHVFYISDEHDCKKNATISFPESQFYYFKREDADEQKQGMMYTCNLEKNSFSRNMAEKCSKIADFSVYGKDYINLEYKYKEKDKSFFIYRYNNKCISNNSNYIFAFYGTKESACKFRAIKDTPNDNALNSLAIPRATSITLQ